MFACRGVWGSGMRLRLCYCVYGLCLGSLYDNRIGTAGAAAIGAGLVHLPQLQTLEYVVCWAVSAGPRRALAPENWAMACVRVGVPVCVWLVFA